MAKKQRRPITRKKTMQVDPAWLEEPAPGEEPEASEESKTEESPGRAPPKRRMTMEVDLAWLEEVQSSLPASLPARASEKPPKRRTQAPPKGKTVRPVRGETVPPPDDDVSAEAWAQLRPKASRTLRTVVPPKKKSIAPRKASVPPKGSVTPPRASMRPKASVAPKASMRPKASIAPKASMRPKASIAPKASVRPKGSIRPKAAEAAQRKMTIDVDPSWLEELEAAAPDVPAAPRMPSRLAVSPPPLPEAPLDPIARRRSTALTVPREEEPDSEAPPPRETSKARARKTMKPPKR